MSPAAPDSRKIAYSIAVVVIVAASGSVAGGMCAVILDSSRSREACPVRRGGREAEGGGLLNRYTGLKPCIEGSNPSLSVQPCQNDNGGPVALSWRPAPRSLGSVRRIAKDPLSDPRQTIR